MSQPTTLCIGMDVHKDSIAVAYIAQDHGAEATYLAVTEHTERLQRLDQALQEWVQS